jgi:hypothetical protein
MKNPAKAAWLAVALLIPAVLGAGRQTPAGAPAVFADPESIVRGLYAAVTFDPGPGPDWEYVRSFFLPQAVIVVRKTRTTMETMTVSEFIQWFVDDVEKHKMKERGFAESVEKLKLTAMGDIAQAFVVYKARFKTPPDAPGQIGLDSWTLMKKDGRWWIVSCANEIPTPQWPLPEELR